MGNIDTKRVGLTLNIQDWHKKGKIDTKGAWLTKKVQDWHKKVGLTPKVQDWRKTYSIYIKRETLAQKGHKWQKRMQNCRLKNEITKFKLTRVMQVKLFYENVGKIFFKLFHFLWHCVFIWLKNFESLFQKDHSIYWSAKI